MLNPGERNLSEPSESSEPNAVVSATKRFALCAGRPCRSDTAFLNRAKKKGGITRLGGFKDYKEVLNTVIGRKTGGGKGATKVTAENTPESVDSDLAQLWSNAQRE